MFFFLPTQAGEFFGEMGFVVVAVLCIAMIESFFFLPTHLAHSKGLKENHQPSKLERWFDALLKRFRDQLYLPLFKKIAVGSRLASALAVLVFIACFAGAIGLIGTGQVGFTFFPNLDDDAVFVELSMKPGTPVELTQEKLALVEEAVWRMNEEYSQGRADGEQVVRFV
jgi:multidrug efflux pump subunit AcrB